MIKWLFDDGGILLVGLFAFFIIGLGATKKGPNPRNPDGSCACGNCDGNGNRY